MPWHRDPLDKVVLETIAGLGRVGWIRLPMNIMTGLTFTIIMVFALVANRMTVPLRKSSAAHERAGA
ncbi:MAG: hypothetical protein WD906_06700 [Anaerolineales bacterium]